MDIYEKSELLGKTAIALLNGDLADEIGGKKFTLAVEDRDGMFVVQVDFNQWFEGDLVPDAHARFVVDQSEFDRLVADDLLVETVKLRLSSGLCELGRLQRSGPAA